ncbi:MAG TPA: pyridine nucleotide-disulfide oxidoreductase, partial [Rhodobacteraceae bacterium]|nr:pyridine nucleotide-disulfide oxidoreductase [Paracoccaceae bacterium]
MTRFIIIGAGQAGATLVETLRKRGFDGEITMIGEEPVPPYQRPPLSKGYLLGDMELERLFLRPVDWYEAHNVTLLTSTRVTKIEPNRKSVTLDNGQSLPYEKLALATGAAPHRLPARIGGELGGVYSVRSLADVDGMKNEFTPGRRVLVIGGGYIGLEAAAVAAKLG